MSLSALEVKRIVADHFALDAAVVDRLELSYTTFIGENENTKNCVIENTTYLDTIEYRVNADKSVPAVPLQLVDLKLKVRYKVDDIIERDTTCDSKYMLEAMRRVAVNMRSKLFWVKMSTPLYLVMDNAGGHGTDQCVSNYTTILKQEYNIEIIQQIPRSPYTNVLDLGVWAGLQSMVERAHFMKRCNLEALVRTVYSVWNTGKLDTIIRKVFLRLERVLALINEGKGSNDRVEDNRGVKFEGMKFDFKKNLNYMYEANGSVHEVVWATIDEDYYELEIDFEKEKIWYNILNKF